MQKDELKVLIIEDDPSLGPALKEALSRADYAASLVKNPEEAFALLEKEEFNAFIVDCMLPKTNGVDFIIQINQQGHVHAPKILTSGIYKDKNFIRDSLRKTQGTAFFVKPFNVEELTQTLDQEFGITDSEFSSPLYSLLTDSAPSTKALLRSLQQLDQIHGFDLPMIYSFLGEAGVTGHLNIIDSDGAVSGVGFSEGEICQVDVKGSTSFFVQILIEKGFIQPREVEEALKIPSTKRIGERLIDANLLSPHAVDIVLKEQMGILLSKTVSDIPVTVNFITSENISGDVKIDSETFAHFLHDWVTSKVPDDWLGSFYTQWMDHPIRKGPQFDQQHELLAQPLFRRVAPLLDKFTNGVTLQQLLEYEDFKEEDVLMATHLFMLRRVIILDQKEQDVSPEKRIKRFQKMASEIENKNYFQVLGVSPKVNQLGIDKAFRDLKKIYSPQALPSEAPTELQQLAEEVYSKIQKAYDSLSDSAKRKDYLQQLENSKAESRLRSEALFSEGKAFLKKNQISKSYKAFSEAVKLHDPSTELTLHYLWSKLKLMDVEKNVSRKILSEVLEKLDRIPPEERHSTTYYFVNGLWHLLNRQLPEAKLQFEHALARDRTFIEARRELNRIKLTSKNKTKDILSADLKDVVGMFFKKRSG